MNTLHAPEDAARLEQVYSGLLTSKYRRTSAMFAWLMVIQWLACIVAAMVISPYTWIGEQNRVHQHVWMAVILGGLIAVGPVVLAITRPKERLTRHVIAASQCLFSSLLIHMTGGRIETHFHVFGSMAFLAIYRDWTVLLTATVVVAADHLLRGVFIPLSVFGSATASPWRWTEHAGWLVFENIILVHSCRTGLKEMHGIADRQVRLERAKAATQAEVEQRTCELRIANEELQATAAERQALHERLLVTSRQAGMAEVASGVLHNVGNVLNSVNVAANLLSDRVRRSEVGGLVRAADMLAEHEKDLPDYLARDERGRHLPRFIIEAAHCVDREHRDLEKDLSAVTQGVEHIKQVIRLQQEHAKHSTLSEEVHPETLLDSALKMQFDEGTHRDIEVVRDFRAPNPISLEKHRVMQILVNVIKNAIQAIRMSPNRPGRLTLSVSERAEGVHRQLVFEVADNGVGIEAENFNKIFSHGFTTRDDGHGFGLHSSATAAQAMGGSLTASSPGKNQGASFVLVLPEKSSSESDRATAPKAAA